MDSDSPARLYRWDALPEEKITDSLRRRFITGERMMISHLYMDEGCVVPMHSHENEQLTYVLEGALRFRIGGEDEHEEILVRAGEVLHIPANVPHSAEAVEDTLDVDVFSPPRKDWLEGTDTYFQE